ncbi:MAG TPA: hypothetical protein VF153_08060 [Candidatus Limnocylindria bacterium]
MPGSRSLVLLAMLAALVWTPSSVSAAQPNQLSSGDALPVVGDSPTSFVLSVQYASTGSNAAQTVTAMVAGQTIPLALLSGSALDGIWGATVTLPEGVWIVTFNATTAGGPQPPPTYSEVTVNAPASSPAPAPSDDPSGTDDPGNGPGRSANPAPQATASPRASHPAPQRQAARPSSSAAPEITRGEGDRHERPRPRRARDDDPSATPESEIAGGTGTPPPEPIKQPGPDGLWWVLVWGSGVVGIIALMGTGWLLLAGRRERRAAEAGDLDADLAGRAIPTVEQRALRRARLRQSDDPILAGLGLDEKRTRPKPRAATRAASPRPRRGGRPQH